MPPVRATPPAGRRHRTAVTGSSSIASRWAWGSLRPRVSRSPRPLASTLPARERLSMGAETTQPQVRRQARPHDPATGPSRLATVTWRNLSFRFRHPHHRQRRREHKAISGLIERLKGRLCNRGSPAKKKPCSFTPRVRKVFSALINQDTIWDRYSPGTQPLPEADESVQENLWNRRAGTDSNSR